MALSHDLTDTYILINVKAGSVLFLEARHIMKEPLRNFIRLYVFSSHDA